MFGTVIVVSMISLCKMPAKAHAARRSSEMRTSMRTVYHQEDRKNIFRKGSEVVQPPRAQTFGQGRFSNQTQFRQELSSRRWLSLSYPTSLFGTPVVNQTTTKETELFTTNPINNIVGLSVSDIKMSDITPLIGPVIGPLNEWANKTQRDEEAKGMLIDLSQRSNSIVTDKDVIIQFNQTSKELTNCALNPFTELRALDYALQRYCSKYNLVNSSYLLTKDQIDCFKDESYALAILLFLDWKQADKGLNKIKHSTEVTQRDCLNSETNVWPKEWIEAWQDCFDKLKKQTAEQVQDLSFQVKETFPFYGNLHVFSDVPSYLWDKNAEVFQIFSDAWKPRVDINGVPIKINIPPKKTLTDASQKALSIISDEDLISYYNKKNREQPPYDEVFTSFHNSLCETSQQSSQLVNKQKRPIVSKRVLLRKDNKLITPERLDQLRLRNRRTVELAACIFRPQEPENDEPIADAYLSY